AHMRTTLIGGLLRSVELNFNHGTRNVRIFEIGKCFTSIGEAVDETERLALVATGARNENDWLAASARLDFYDLKGAVEGIFEVLELPTPVFELAQSPAFLHPGRSAQVYLGNTQVGEMGQLHPRVAAHYKFKQPVFIAELNLGQLLLADPVEVRYHPLPKFPTVVRDLAILIDKNVPFKKIEDVIYGLGIPELVGIRLFDIHAGKELPEGKHSIALSLRYRAADRTLTDDEINAAHNHAVKTLVSEFGADVR